jgi:multiple sugar transport system substrate-binding protein
MNGWSASRRGVMLGAAAAALAAGGLGARDARAQAKLRLRMFWWGSQERTDRTLKMDALYTKAHPNVTFSGETLGWSDYWPRLATQAAGQNLPDIIQMDYRYIVEYASRGALLPLDKYLGKQLAIEDFGKDSIDSGRVDGKLYGVNLGNNSVAMTYRLDSFANAKLPVPDEKTTWADFAKMCAEINKSTNGAIHGTQDAGGTEPVLECWLRQRGKALYTADGKLAFNADDMTEWFNMWTAMRASGACVPADQQALDHDSLETNMVTLGHAACGFVNSNQLIGMQVLNSTKLGETMFPQGGPGSKPGQYLKPSQMWSIAASTENADAAVDVVNYSVENPDGVRALGVERGVPASPAMRDVLKPTLDAQSQGMVEFIAFITDKVGPLPPAPPPGAGEIQVRLRRANQEVGFGRSKPADAAKQFISDARDVLAQG